MTIVLNINDLGIRVDRGDEKIEKVALSIQLAINEALKDSGFQKKNGKKPRQGYRKDLRMPVKASQNKASLEALIPDVLWNSEALHCFVRLLQEHTDLGREILLLRMINAENEREEAIQVQKSKLNPPTSSAHWKSAFDL